METLNFIADKIKGLKRVLIVTHVWADADAIGSSCALCLGLCSLGIDAEVLLPDDVNSNYVFFLDGVKVVREANNVPYDALIGIDCGDLKRLSLGDKDMAFFSRLSINIDHHRSNTLWASYNFIDDKAAAATQIVARLLKTLDIVFTAKIANLLYAGLMDDTGCFRFSNTNYQSLLDAADFVKHGANPEIVANNLYFSVPEKVLRLRSMVLSTLRLKAEKRVAVAHVTKEMLNNCGLSSKEAQGLVDLARNVAGTLAIVLLRELDDGEWKLSLRAKDQRIDVNSIAAIFGGGGHKAAAGCKIKGELHEVENKILEHLEKAVRELESDLLNCH